MLESDDLPAWFNFASCEARVPADHPLRIVRAVVDEALDVLAPVLDWLDARGSAVDIAPRKLLRAMLLQALFSIRSEQRLLEQLDYNLLFRWFVGVSMDAPIWDADKFSENRDRLLAGGVAQPLLGALIARRRIQALMADEQLCLDSALIETWVSPRPAQAAPDRPAHDPALDHEADIGARPNGTGKAAFSPMPGVY